MACLSGITCDACGHISFPVRPVCPNCLALEVRETPVGARGRLCMYTVSHVAPEGFEAPLVQAWVNMEEGPEVFSLLFCSVEEAAKLSPGQRLGLEMLVDKSGARRWGYRPIF